VQVPEPLVPLFDDGVILSVVRPLMSGKEASVFIVETREGRCVAKVYKEANNRSFRQRSDYAEGRTVRNSRQARAMAKGSKYGKSLLEAEWQNAEVSALYRLHDAGVRVPAPYHFSDGVLLMEMICGDDGNPAPRLWDVRFSAEEALQLHGYLVRQAVRMLCAGMVHGDLSEYNILLAPEGAVIIDLPQATDAAHNRNSERLFLRDVKNLKQFLGRFAPTILKTQYGREIWGLYQDGQLQPESALTGRAKKKTRRADTRSVIEEIQAAAREASERPMSAYQEKKQRKIAEAIAEAEREAERQAKRAEARAARGEPPPKRAKPSAGRGERPAKTEAGPGEGAPKRRRRRRRRRRD
jgi:RIO kinase 1